MALDIRTRRPRPCRRVATRDPQLPLRIEEEGEVEVDLFAGGGGASEGMEQATGRPPKIAVNHSAVAVGMHALNHPRTIHYCKDVWEVDPDEATGNWPIGHLHASPDCTDHSQAKGGQPRAQEIRSLAWVILRWMGKKRPRVVTLENVKQMLQWSPLIAKRDPATGRVITLDIITDPVTKKKRYRVADPGEQVPRRNQFLVPDPKRKGHNWERFIGAMLALGYVVQWRVICNANLGAHSTRERLYLVARRDGQPIVWPQQTHAKNARAGLEKWRPVSECIDWSIPGRSIFGRERPLADATMRRIAHGMVKFVTGNADPFIVPVTHTDISNRARPVSDPAPTVTGANRGELMLVAPALVPVTYTQETAYDPQAPMRTITTAKGGETALMAATLVQTGYGERPAAFRCTSCGATFPEYRQGDEREPGHCPECYNEEGIVPIPAQAPRVLDINDPLGTVVAGGGKHALATAFMVQANAGFNTTHARDAEEPASTITTSGSQQQLITAHLTTWRRHTVGTELDEPAPTITAAGEHHGLVEYRLSKEDEEGALRCAAFLMRYHTTGGQWADLNDPATTVTTKDRLALVTVWIKGDPYVVVDICLRMLVPRELYNAQDFPAHYIIDRTVAGKVLTKTEQVQMVGNSVCPLVMRLIIQANYKPRLAEQRMAA